MCPAIEGYPSGDAVENLDGRVDYKDPSTTQLWKSVNNLTKLTKQHIQAGQSQALSGQFNPHGIGITRYTFSVPLVNNGAAVSKQVIIAADISDLWMAAELWTIRMDSGDTTHDPTYWALGNNATTLDDTFIQQQMGYVFISTSAQNNQFSTQGGTTLGDGGGIGGAGLGDPPVFAQIRTYTGKTAPVGFGTDVGSDTISTGGDEILTGDPTIGFMLDQHGHIGNRVGLWKDAASGHLTVSMQDDGSNDQGKLITGHVDLTAIPNTGFGSSFALTGEAAATQHSHDVDYITSDGTDSFLTTRVFNANTTRVWADGNIKIRTIDYYEDSGLQAVNFGSTVPASVVVVVSYEY